MVEESFGIIPLKRSSEGWAIFLIQQKNGGHWGFPKGKRAGEETPLESAQRELTEETGLKIEELLQEEPLVEEYFYSRKGEKIHKTVFYFIALVSGKPVLQVNEIFAGEWFSFNEAEKKLTFEESKKLLAQCSFF